MASGCLTPVLKRDACNLSGASSLPAKKALPFLVRIKAPLLFHSFNK